MKHFKSKESTFTNGALTSESFLRKHRLLDEEAKNLKVDFKKIVRPSIITLEFILRQFLHN